MKDDFVSSARSVSDMKAHLVLTTKYRRKVLDGAMITRLHDVFYDLCQKWDCKLIEFNGESDHVHILFQYYPQMDMPKFINNIKSVSSRRIRAEFADAVDAVYWKDVLWNKSYFIASCGGVTVSVLRQYIENQATPEDHRSPTLRSGSHAFHPDAHPSG
jgi:putative transposase